jgi:hypothetical protein
MAVALECECEGQHVMIIQEQVQSLRGLFRFAGLIDSVAPLQFQFREAGLQ